jgi:Uncharacterized protein conserved in archaea
VATVTLIGSRLAEEGTEFVYQGDSEACDGCPYRGQCLNLVDGRRYRVTDVRENTQTLDCAVHDTGVRAVEVEPAAGHGQRAGEGRLRRQQGESRRPVSTRRVSQPPVL